MTNRIELTDRQSHENSRYQECQGVARVLAEACDVATQHRREEARDEGAEVDGKVKDGEECGQVFFLLG